MQILNKIRIFVFIKIKYMNTNRKSKFSNIKWTAEIDNFIIDSHFNKKKSLIEIGKQLEITSIAISRRIKKLGFNPINYQNLKSYTFEDIVLFLEDGNTLTKAAKHFGVSIAALSKILHKHNYTIKQNLFNENVFDTIDTEEKAYWLGFIFADGSISSTQKQYTFELSLKIEDIEHLNKFNQFMEHKKDNVKISKTKTNGKEFTRCRWYVNNKHLWETLNSYGCVPKKSLILKFPNKSIFHDENLIPHFIRGYFDGDGCISRVIRKTLVVPSISILGTPEFIKELTKQLNVEYKITKHHHHDLQTVDYRQQKRETVHKILNFLYKNANVYLDRKYKLYEFFKNGSRSIQEWVEFNESKTVNVCDDNAVVNVETKESTSPYSVEIEPANAE